jgi:hypoxanthine-DNA glycosylase
VERGRVASFAPVARADARLLILGSMPGAASLAACEYYAHPQNQFWPIIDAIIGHACRETPYEQRLESLREAHIALWDVLHSCVREGSLDSAIVHPSAHPNDIPGLLAGHPGIVRICCNGTTAHAALLRYFGAQLPVQVQRLPSTSPANARVSFAGKLAAWRAALTPTRG